MIDIDKINDLKAKRKQKIKELAEIEEQMIYAVFNATDEEIEKIHLFDE